jgi:ribose-phosphate pyrophosphokinase
MILLNGQEIKLSTFPNGETCVDGGEIQKLFAGMSIRICNITLKYENDNDLIRLMFVKKYIDKFYVKSFLTVTYFPYSRMDRVEGDSVFTLKDVANFINSLKFESVTIYEPHSDVTPALLNNCIVKHMTVDILNQTTDEIGFDENTDYIYYPDASAEKHFGKTLTYKSLTGLKQRDFATGRIKKLDIAGELPKEKGFKVVMLDDLCSRGGTFMLGATKLKELGASEIYLIVAHCENSIFEGDILTTDLIDKVFTTNSILDKNDNNKIKIIDILGGNK